jgi:hypothetical protein
LENTIQILVKAEPKALQSDRKAVSKAEMTALKAA